MQTKQSSRLWGIGGRSAISGRLMAVLRQPLYTTSLFLSANTVANAGLGSLFWIVATRLGRPEDVGLGSALISAALLLLFVTELGLATAVVRYLPTAGSAASRLVNSYLTLSCLAAVVAALVFLIGTPLWSPALAFIAQSPVTVMLFAVAVVAGTAMTFLDGVFVVLRRSDFTFAKNALQGILKLVLLLVLSSRISGIGIFASASLATVVAAAVALWLFLPGLLSEYRPALVLDREHLSGEIAGYSVANYLGDVFWGAPTLLLPIVVTNVLGARENAYFFISWSVANAMFSASGSVATSLFAEGSHQTEELRTHFRKSVRLVCLFLLPATVVVLLFGDRLLLIFGKEYSAETTTVLRVMVLSGVPVAVNRIYIAAAKVRRQLGRLVLVPLCLTVGTLGLSYVLIGPLGILGPALAWLATQSVICLALVPGTLDLLRAQPRALATLAVPSAEDARLP